MNKNFLLAILLCLGCIFIAHSQASGFNPYTRVDNIIIRTTSLKPKTTKEVTDFVSLNFKYDYERVRAIFIWIAFNIEFDIENMFDTSIHEPSEEKILNTIKTRRGICEDYALLFHRLCTEIGIKSYIIKGYTKQNDEINNIPHSWNAAFVNEKWYLFDPTWGAGFVKDRKFEKKLNSTYFMIEPSKMIKTHMPYDYLWQFMEHPFSAQDFEDGYRWSDNFYFDYQDSIKAYEAQTKDERIQSSIYRIEKSGVNNLLVAEYLISLKVGIENKKITSAAGQYNLAVSYHNEGITELNTFINFRNNKFAPKKNDFEILKMIETPLDKLSKTKEILGQIEGADRKMDEPMRKLMRSTENALKAVLQNKEWLQLYLQKEEPARNAMLMKDIKFGVPLN